MLKKSPPKSNYERQREFRERHPHYYRDLHRRRKAACEARRQAATQAAALSAPSVPLALPAPTPATYIELPLFAVLHAE